MKKILLPADVITLLVQHENFLDRADLQIFIAESHEEALEIHRDEKLNLIISHFAASGFNTEQFLTNIRKDNSLSHVSILIICPKIHADLECCERCKANAIVTKPVNPDVLLEKSLSLLNIPLRAEYRALLTVKIIGSINNAEFFGRSVNISSSGMLFETDKKLETGNKIVCSFFLPSGIQIKTTAEVVRTVSPEGKGNTWQYGIRYVRLTAEGKKALQDLVRMKTGS